MLAYSPDSRSVVVDVRQEKRRHPFEGFPIRPVRELAWWDWTTGTAQHRFRLRDALNGPCGALANEEDRGDWDPAAAFDVSWCFDPWRIAAAWEWTNKEDGVCVFDVDGQAVVDLRTPYRTHVQRLALAPDGNRLAVATVNDMDGSAELEAWELAPPPPPPAEAWRGLSPRQAMRRERFQQSRTACQIPHCVLTSLAFNGRVAALACADQPSVLLWDFPEPPPDAVGPESMEYGIWRSPRNPGA
jgi:hypothetical protein